LNFEPGTLNFRGRLLRGLLRLRLQGP
jgi:hypothetical protein